MSTRIRKQTQDPRDNDPKFQEYLEQWTSEIGRNPRLAALPPRTQASYAAQMARSSVRLGPRVWR